EADQRERREHGDRQPPVDREQHRGRPDDRQDVPHRVPDVVEEPRDEAGVVRRAGDQVARADPVVVAGVELERAPEDPVADVRVGARIVENRVVVPHRAGDRLDDAKGGDAGARPPQRPAAVVDDAPIHGTPDEQRGGDRRRLPAQPRQGGEDNRSPERPRDREQVAPTSIHTPKYSAMSSRPPIEERFPPGSVMGVINVTPDSFSDGGRFFRLEPAVTEAWGMLECGAAIVDVGGESTRPGSLGVSAEEELSRVEPVIADLAGAPVSIDTSKAPVARRALELGAELVNDVTALRGDPELAGVVADAGAYLCLMHMQGEPRTMQDDPHYDDVVSEVKAFLEERLAFAVDQGVDERRICLDPGIGFGKTAAHNFELVRRLNELAAIGRPLLVGLSRKSSLGSLTGSRVGTVSASVGAAVAAFDRGATILRVHDVREHVEALAAAKAVAG